MSDKLFRALVRLLPEEFRAGYAREMEATFRAEAKEAAGHRWAIARLWVATITDLLRTAPSEHVEILLRDTRFALRTMAARPVHTLTAILTLALGIGANVAMFAVIDGVLLAPLPYRDPDALVWVGESSKGDEPGTMGYLSFIDLRERARGFETLVAAPQSTATLTDHNKDAERVNAMRTSRAYFDMLGVQPSLGRTFTEAEDRPGAARRITILSDALWRRRFGGDPSVVGRVIDISGIPHQVVGVMPAGFTDLLAERLYRSAELWFPLGYDPAAVFACRTCRHLMVFGRLKLGVTRDAAEREAAQIFATLEKENPTEYHAAGAGVITVAEMFLGPVRPVLLVLWAGVVGLLLVACSHVASLLLLRSSERSHEIAVRGALGVSRGRMARQLLTESILLAGIGGAAGLLSAWAAVRLLTIAGPAELPRLATVSIDARVVLVALVVINRSMADTLFPGEDAVGHRIRLGPPDALPRTIVGIVADIRHRGLEALPGNQVYVPQPQWAWAETSMTLVIRAKSNPETLVGPIREILRTIDPQQPITNVQLYDAIVAESMATPRFAAGLLGIFAATALMLSIVGLYGLSA